ncbi:MAG: hypothetical protein HYR72_13070 [Deltaproteobacteria bacterium]|nr:hypothetical protein [Deltaproteobacteria bacterium]MBI3390489.1 hypothetical protein [Deltaproteobacteria bacterium]
MGGDNTADRSVTLDHNDYFANGGYFGDIGTFGANCGLFAQINDTDATPHNLIVTSTSDFWGGSGGPGSDPKDDAGTTSPNCQEAINGTITLNVVTPAATEFRVIPPSIK